MNMMEIITVSVILLVAGALFIWRPWKDDLIDRTSKDESKLPDDSTQVEEIIEVTIKKDKKPRSPRKSRAKKPQEIDNCALVETEIAEKPVRKQANK